MLAFVDESGDPGRKLGRGSSLYFIVAIVTFEDNDDANKCDHAITDLRTKLKLPPGYEFHFSHNSKRIKEAFLKAVAPFPFFYHAFALNKDPQKLTGVGFDNKESLYKITARFTFENAKPHLHNASVVIDRSGERKFRDELAAYLRKRILDDGGNHLIKKVKIQRSNGNNLLQLADYVAGVTNKVVSNKQDGKELRKKYLAAHESTMRFWPK